MPEDTPHLAMASDSAMLAPARKGRYRAPMSKDKPNEFSLDELRTQIRAGTYADEAAVIDQILSEDRRSDGDIRAAQKLGIALISA